MTLIERWNRFLCWLLCHDYIPYVDRNGTMRHVCARRGCGEGWAK